VVEVASTPVSPLTLAHRRDLQRLLGIAGRQVRSVVARADMSAIANWWTTGAGAEVERVAIQGHDTAAALTVRYLLDHAAANGAEVAPLPARLDLDQLRGSLFVLGPGAALSALRRTNSTQVAKRVLTSGLVSSVNKSILAGDRDTVMGTFRAGR
jgi:hypothetical protein